MEYDKDFVNEEPVKIEIEGREFLYKPVTGGDENDWLTYIMVPDEETKQIRIDWGRYNKKKLGNIVSVPYDKETINKIIGRPKEWKDMNSDERYLLFSKLKPGLLDKIINKMKQIDSGDTESIKN